jgi:hypothetical protein
MIDHDVMGLYISVHDSSRMAEIQCLESKLGDREIKRSRTEANLEKFEHVKSDIEVGESWIKNLEVDVVDEFSD